MINKIKNKRLFDHKDKTKHPLHEKLNDDFGDDQIIMEIDHRGGVQSCTEDQLWRLCCAKEELETMGWASFKKKLLNDGTITQADIDTEKVKPAVQVKLQEFRQKKNP